MPEGYDASGISRYYSQEVVASSLRDKLPFHARVLRVGDANDLQLVKLITPPELETKIPGYGLKEYIRTSFGTRKTPVYIFDDHNHAFFAWVEALKAGRIVMGADLYHVDEHLDGVKVPDFPTNLADLQQMADYSKSLYYSDFIHPALRMGIVREVYWTCAYWKRKYCTSLPESKHEIGCNIFDSEDFPTCKFSSKRTIADIDLDFFGKTVMDLQHEKQEIARLRHLMRSAGVITMAISPGFIEGRRAIQLIKELLK